MAGGNDFTTGEGGHADSRLHRRHGPEHRPDQAARVARAPGHSSSWRARRPLRRTSPRPRDGVLQQTLDLDLVETDRQRGAVLPRFDSSHYYRPHLHGDARRRLRGVLMQQGITSPAAIEAIAKVRDGPAPPAATINGYGLINPARARPGHGSEAADGIRQDLCGACGRHGASSGVVSTPVSPDSRGPRRRPGRRARPTQKSLRRPGIRRSPRGDVDAVSARRSARSSAGSTARAAICRSMGSPLPRHRRARVRLGRRGVPAGHSGHGQ